MKLLLKATISWKYLELLQKKDASQGLNTREKKKQLSFLKFCASKVDTGDSEWSGKRQSHKAASEICWDVTTIPLVLIGHESLEEQWSLQRKKKWVLIYSSPNPNQAIQTGKLKYPRYYSKGREIIIKKTVFLFFSFLF